MIEALFRRCFDATPDVVTYAPGRVNLIGEHTDYNDGFVLPCAIDKGTFVAVRARADRTGRIIAGNLDKAEALIDLSAPIRPDASTAWANYVRGMVHGLATDGLDLPGFDMAILGGIPRGAGLSSSASLEIAAGLALATLAGQPDFDRTRLAQLGQLAEHHFAGCMCGIMDQLVSARASEGSALLIDCRSLAVEPVAIPSDVAIMMVHSGVERGLVDGAYDARREQCEMAARHYGVTALRDLSVLPEQAGLDTVSYRRARHVITENARTLAAADALRCGDLTALGRLMATSHASMRDDFEITVPPVDALVGLLTQALNGEGGARMTGGGFGGAVVAIVHRSAIDPVRHAVTQGYVTPDGQAPLILSGRPATGAHIVSQRIS
jgi:galactokinase